MELRQTRFTAVLAAAGLAASLLLAACGGAASPPAGGGGTPVATAAAAITPAAASSPTTAAAGLPTNAPTVSSTPSAATTGTPVGATPAVTTTSASTPPTNATPATTTASATADTTPSASTSASPAGTTPSQSASASTGGIRYDVVPAGSQAQYQAVEQLVGRDLPSDAIGTTTGVSGNIVLNPDGQIVPSQSKVVVDLSTLTSDQSRRDNFIKRSTLETAQYPTATFVPTAIQGLPSPLPTSGSHSFQVLGNLTVHGVTKPATWNVTAQANGGNVTGQATTTLTFEDFGMAPPKAGPVLSVQDNVKLVVTLHLTRSNE
jgi:polyisoprenoid-binding protein YceI